MRRESRSGKSEHSESSKLLRMLANCLDDFKCPIMIDVLKT